MKSETPLLKVTGLNKRFGALTATSDLNLEVRSAEIHALIGPNGAGKTTLINQLTGDILPDSGAITFLGKDISRWRPDRRSRLGMARSYQITHIFGKLTVAENMALAICAQNGHSFRFWRPALKIPLVRTQLDEALARVDLLPCAHRPAATLAHGEKRQLEVGMALVGRPKLLIMDEPMAGLGPGGTIELTNLIRGLRGLTILLVEHDMQVVFSLADRVSVLVAGNCIATGTPAEIRNDAKVRAAYLGED